MTNAYYESTWAWLEEEVGEDYFYDEYVNEYSFCFDDLLSDIISDLWDIYPYGKLSLDAVSDFVSLIL